MIGTFFGDSMSKPSIIAHRGNMNGPNPTHENHPDYLHAALKEGLGIEYDLWYIDGLWALGHDRPQYQVTLPWLLRLGASGSADTQSMTAPRAWAHCKNLAAFTTLNGWSREGGRNQANYLNYFWHEVDLFTTTNLGYLWMHPRALEIPVGSAWVVPNINAESVNAINLVKARWICTDDAQYLQKVSK
jgi:hypothetical protein